MVTLRGFTPDFSQFEVRAEPHSAHFHPLPAAALLVFLSRDTEVRAVSPDCSRAVRIRQTLLSSPPLPPPINRPAIPLAICQ